MREVGSPHGDDAASIGKGGRGGGSSERKGEHGGRGHRGGDHGGRGHRGGDLERDGWGRGTGVVQYELREVGGTDSEFVNIVR